MILILVVKHNRDPAGSRPGQVYPGVLALFREITAHRAAQQREKPKERNTSSCSATGSLWTEVHRTGEAIERLTPLHVFHHPCIWRIFVFALGYSCSATGTTR